MVLFLILPHGSIFQFQRMLAMNLTRVRVSALRGLYFVYHGQFSLSLSLKRKGIEILRKDIICTLVDFALNSFLFMFRCCLLEAHWLRKFDKIIYHVNSLFLLQRQWNYIHTILVNNISLLHHNNSTFFFRTSEMSLWWFLFCVLLNDVWNMAQVWEQFSFSSFFFWQNFAVKYIELYTVSYYLWTPKYITTYFFKQ